MSTATISPNFPIQYSLDAIKEEVRQLIEQGVIRRTQPIQVLSEHMAAREWHQIEFVLESSEYLQRDAIGDLVAYENWDND